MKNKSLLNLVKGSVGLFLFLLLLLAGNTDIAKANSIKQISDTDVKVAKTADFSVQELKSIMSELNGRQLSDGDRFMVDGYQIDVDIVNEPITSSNVLFQSDAYSNNLYSTASTGSETSSYGETCNVYISTLIGNITVAVITHTVNVINFDTGKVHISSGQVSVTPISPTWSGDAYGYTIHNTDGSYSSAYGYVRLDNSTLNGYVTYKAEVSVTYRSSPSFTFTCL